MAQTGILLRRGPKVDFLLHAPLEGEIVYATDTAEHGYKDSKGVNWVNLAPIKAPGGHPPNSEKPVENQNNDEPRLLSSQLSALIDTTTTLNEENHLVGTLTSIKIGKILLSTPIDVYITFIDIGSDIESKKIFAGRVSFYRESKKTKMTLIQEGDFIGRGPIKIKREDQKITQYNVLMHTVDTDGDFINIYTICDQDEREGIFGTFVYNYLLTTRPSDSTPFQIRVDFFDASKNLNVTDEDATAFNDALTDITHIPSIMVQG